MNHKKKESKTMITVRSLQKQRAKYMHRSSGWNLIAWMLGIASLGIFASSASIAYGAPIFIDTFTNANWQDSDEIVDFWSRTQANVYSARFNGTEDGKYINYIAGSSQSNVSARLYSTNLEMFSFANQSITAQFNGIEAIFPDAITASGGTSYSWRYGFGFAENTNTRMDADTTGGTPIGKISVVHALTSGGTEHNRLYLYVNNTLLDVVYLANTGLPIASNSSNWVTPVNVWLTVDPTNVYVSVLLSNDSTVILSGEHGLDPEVDTWIKSPVLSMTNFMGTNQESGNMMGFRMDSIVIIPEPGVTALAFLTAIGVFVMWRRRKGI